jgi:hypothetical protein
MKTSESSLYLLIFRDSSPDVYRRMSPQERQALLTEWNAWYDGLVAKGKVLQGHPLEPNGRIISGGTTRDFDGPYAETKEAVGGFFLLKVADIDEATAIAKQCPSMGLGISMEIRPVANVCPVLRANTAAQEAVAYA